MQEANANVDEQTDGRMNERMEERMGIWTDGLIPIKIFIEYASVMMEFERPYI